MEALAAFGINWKILAIQAINFSLVLAILYRYLYRPLFAMLARRQAEIARGLKDSRDAAALKLEVESTKESVITAAREEGGKIVERLRKEGVEEEHEIIRNAQEKSTALLQESRMKANEEREHILHEAEKDIARMAVLAAERTLRTQK